MRYDSIPIMVNQAMASTNNTTAIIDLTNVFNASVQFTVTSASSPTGTVAITFANDCTRKDDGTISGGNFGADAAVTNPTVTANGTKVVNLPNVGHGFMKVTFTTGTGTGTLNVVAFVKGA